MNSILGTPVFVTPDRPAYRLPSDLQLPQGFREEFHAWADGFFKPRNPLDDGVIVRDMKGAMHMNPRTFDQMKRSLVKARMDDMAMWSTRTVGSR